MPGCDIPQRPVLVEPSETPRRYVKDTSSSSQDSLNLRAVAPVFEPPAAPFAEDWETWNAYYSDGKHCGYGHVRAERLGESSGTATDTASDVRYTIDDHLLLRSGLSSISQQLHHESIEDSLGKLKSFTATQGMGPLTTRFVGTIEDGQLTMVTRRGALESTQSIAWEPNCRGLVAVEQSLRRTPMKHGEVRMLKTLVPVQHRIATVRLFAVERASVPLLDGSVAELLEISSQIAMGERETSRVISWTDDNGTMIKSYTQSLGLLAFRADREMATAEIESDPSADSGVAIRVTGNIDRPNQAKRTAWIVRNRELDHQRHDATSTRDELELNAAAGQAIRRQPDGALQILVSSESVANLPGFVAGTLDVVDADTQPNPLIDFNSSLVRRLHSAATIDGLNERETAIEMMRTIGGVVDKSPRSLGLTKASEVAMTGVADSTGYAVLLAGLLRASKIPARVVVGIVYDGEAKDSMHYHAWTIAHVDGDWLPLDATLGTIAPSNRLALLTSDFASKDLEEHLLNALRQLAKLEITIAKSQY